MKHSIFKIAAAVALTSAAAACTEIDSNPDGRVDFDEIWTSDRFVVGYLNEAYSPFLGITHGQAYGNNTFLDAATDNAQDVDEALGGNMSMWKMGMLTKASTPLSRLNQWSGYYRGIYMCNVLIANIPDANIYVQQDADMWYAEAHGLRALYYLQLIKLYGGVPMVLDTRIDENGNVVPDMVDDSDYDYSHVYRASFAEVARQIIKDCQVVLDSYAIGWRSESDDNLGRVNKAVACAIMSEAALFAASPLNYDASDSYAIDWNEAAQITKSALDQCVANGYKISTTKPSSAGNQDELAANAYDHMFLQKPNFNGTTDPEMILYRNQTQVWNYSTAPILAGHSRAGACPSQELVDAYETIDGKAPILGYSDAAHLNPIYNQEALYDPTTNPTGKYNEKDPYANRDPRLRATIYYNGATAHMKAAVPVIQTGEGAAHQINATSVRYTHTGYYLHKYFNITSSRSLAADGYYRIFRLAELYLNYAEAAAEAGEPASTVLAAVKPVRDRVGMPQWSSDITNDRDKLIERIRNERRIEFAFEDHRFFDIRRWKILDQTATVSGMRPIEDITTTTEPVLDENGEPEIDEETGVVKTQEVVHRELKGYQRFNVSTSKAVSDKFLRMPISISEQVTLENATGRPFQNPGW